MSAEQTLFDVECDGHDYQARHFKSLHLHICTRCPSVVVGQCERCPYPEKQVAA